MEGTACTAAGSHAEVGFAGESALFLIRSGHGMLETGRIRRVTGDGHIHTFVPHDGHTFTDVIRAVAFHLRTGTVRIGNLLHDFQFTGEIIELGLNVCETVDTGDNHGSVLSETVQDAAERFLADLVSLGCDLDGAFGGCERFVTGEESETFGLLTEKTGGEVTVSDTHLAVIGHRTGDTE